VIGLGALSPGRPWPNVARAMFPRTSPWGAVARPPMAERGPREFPADRRRKRTGRTFITPSGPGPTSGNRGARTAGRRGPPRPGRRGPPHRRPSRPTPVRAASLRTSTTCPWLIPPLVRISDG
jgi:hypothetical protein